jgi:hypothetical protein
MEVLSGKRNTFASWMYLTERSELAHTEITIKLKEPSKLLQKKEYAEAGRHFLILWQDVQTQQQNIYSMSTFVSWDLDMATSQNGASIWIKELEELGISLIRDAAMAFFLAVDETYKKENIRRYMKRENESSPWPRLGEGVTYGGKPFDKGTGIDLVLEDVKHPLDILLDNCTTNREVADMLSYFYFIKSAGIQSLAKLASPFMCGHCNICPTPNRGSHPH